MGVKEELLEVDQAALLDDDQPELEFEEEFEILDEDEFSAQQPDEPEETITNPLQSKLEEMQEQFAQLKQQAQTSQSNPGMDKMAELLKEMRQQNQPQPKQVNDPEAIKKKRESWKEKVFDQPVDVFEDWAETTLGPVVGNIMSQMETLQQQVARQNAANNPQYKDIMKDYGDEVDQMAKNFKNDPEAYSKACAFVGMNHFNEIMEKKMAENQPVEKEKPKKPLPYNSAQQQPSPPKPRKRQVVLKPQEKREFERQFAVSVFGDRKTFYDNVWAPTHNK
jgi:hypothetical protein